MDGESDWTSRDPRTKVQLTGTITRANTLRHPVRVTNISAKGCRVESDRQLIIGESVTLAVPERGEWRARVRWALLDSAGLEFATNDAALRG